MLPGRSSVLHSLDIRRSPATSLPIRGQASFILAVITVLEWTCPGAPAEMLTSRRQAISHSAASTCAGRIGASVRDSLISLFNTAYAGILLLLLRCSLFPVPLCRSAFSAGQGRGFGLMGRAQGNENLWYFSTAGAVPGP